MTGREFSQVLGISHEYLRRLEIGLDPRSNKTIKPTIKMLNKIEDALKDAQSSGLILLNKQHKEVLAVVRQKIYEQDGYYKEVEDEDQSVDLLLKYETFLNELAQTKLSLGGKLLERNEVINICTELKSHFLDTIANK